MTVGDLKIAIKDMPDDRRVMILTVGGTNELGRLRVVESPVMSTLVTEPGDDGSPGGDIGLATFSQDLTYDCIVGVEVL